MMSIAKVIVDKKKPPSEWKVVHYADIGTSDEFVAQFLEIANDLLGATQIFDPSREKIKSAIWTIMDEGLMPAFEKLKQIRASVGQQMPLLTRRQLYEDFARVIWHGYKDLMPKAVNLFGADVGFMFRDEKEFEKGLSAFNVAHPNASPRFGDFLRAQRSGWQNELSDFRNNYLEHRKRGPEAYPDFYKPDEAEGLFDAVWRTIAEILVMFLAMNMPPGTGFVEIPVAERTGNPVRRFRFVMPALEAYIAERSKATEPAAEPKSDQS